MTKPTTPVHGICHYRVGGRVVTAILDGGTTASYDLVIGIPAQEAEALDRAALRPAPPRLTINTFLIWGDNGRHALVDTGAAGRMGTQAGRLPMALAAAGVDARQIATVLLTHFHSDHIGGLASEDGSVAFPEAEVVAPQAELDFWLDDDAANRASERTRSTFERARAILRPYRDADRLRGVAQGEALPGVSIVPEHGHTPGHSGWMVTDGAESLLIWGDIVHLPGIQFARPDAGVAFDIDGPAAVGTRQRIMDMAATDRLAVCGAHLDFPAFGRVERVGSGYRFSPVQWAFDI